MFKTIKNRIQGSELIQSVMTLSTGSIISQLIPILASFILARLFSPDDYGDWAIFSSYTSILLILACGRYEYAILRPKKNVDALNLVALSLIIALALCLFLCGILLLPIEQIKSIKGRVWIPIFVLFSAITQVLNNYANRKEKYALIAKSSVIRSSSQSILRILFGLTKFYANGLIIGATLGMIISNFYLDYKLNLKKDFRKCFSWRKLKELSRIYSKFPIYDIPSGLLNAMSTNIPILLLSYYFSKYYVGNFSMAITLLYMPMSFIGTAMGQVFYKKACSWTNQDNIAQLSFKLFQFNYWLGFIPCILLVLIGDTMFAIFLGEKWRLAGTFAMYLSPWLWCVLCFSPLSTIFLVIDKQKIAMYLNLLMFIVRIAIIILGKYLTDSIGVTIALYGISSLFLWILEGYILYKYIDIKLKLSDKIIISGSGFIVLLIWFYKIWLSLI